MALHRLASEDSLWRALYDKEFLVGGAPATAAAAGAVPRAPPAADVALAQARGWKHVFGVRWREREERRRQRWVRGWEGMCGGRAGVECRVKVHVTIGMSLLVGSIGAALSDVAEHAM